MQRHALTMATALFAAGMLTACGSDKPTAPNTITYVADLSGATEVPANSSTATGKWTGVLNLSTNVMTYTLTYSGLSGTGSGAHIHAQADATHSASVVLNFATFAGATTAFANGQASGTAAGAVNMSSAATPPSFTISGDSLRKAMDAGMAYVNVHSSPSFGGGEIRGQIHKQ